jgi:hypothetical protein
MTTHASLEQIPLEVVPGGQVVCRLFLRNTGHVVEAYRLEVLGDAAAWARVEPPELTLYPNAEDSVEVIFQPPRSGLIEAGDVPFAVRVVPSEASERAVAPEHTLTVLPFVETTAELTPRTSRGQRRARHEVAVDNRGNLPIKAVLHGVDLDGQVTVQPTPATLNIPAGQAAFSTISVRNRRQLWRGAPQTHQFQVLVEAEGIAPIVLEGTTLQTPALPRGGGRILAAFVTLLLLLAAGWFLLLKPAVNSAAKEAVEKPLAVISQQADSAGKKADNAGKKADDAAAGSGGGGGGAASPSVSTGSDPLTAAKSTAPARIRLQTVLGAGSTAGTDAYVVPAKSTLIVTDLVLQNPQGDTGRVDVLVDGAAILTLALANFRDLDFHFVSPIQVPAGKSLTLRTTCQTPGAALTGTTGNQCRVWMFASGVNATAATAP